MNIIIIIINAIIIIVREMMTQELKIYLTTNNKHKPNTRISRRNNIRSRGGVMVVHINLDMVVVVVVVGGGGVGGAVFGRDKGVDLEKKI